MKGRALFCLFSATIGVFHAHARPAAADALTIDRCGEVVPAGAVAYLVSDLDCRGAATSGVVLEDRARLVFAGHSIIGDPEELSPDGAALQGVRCEAGSVCTLEGPGEIRGFSASGVAGTRVRLSDVRITGNAKAGVSAFENVRMRGVVIADNASVAVHAGGRVHARNSELGEDPQAAIAQWGAPQVRPADVPQS